MYYSAMCGIVQELELGISQSLGSVSGRPDPTGKSASETRKIVNVQDSSQDTVEPSTAVPHSK